MGTNGNIKELIKDLCSRLPYGVKVNVIYSKENASSFRQRVCVEGDNELTTDIIGLYQRDEIDIKPYLFPLSSMTEEQKEEYHNNCNVGLNRWGDEVYYDSDESIDWLNAHHFDHRRLIEKLLALDATGLNIY